MENWGGTSYLTNFLPQENRNIQYIRAEEEEISSVNLAS